MQERDSRNAIGRVLGQLTIVLAGIVLGQFIIYGPSLTGSRLLLPLDLLATPGWYLPMTPEVRKIVPHDHTLSDQILQFETERRFSASEWRAGRLPMWMPYQYAGVPLVWPKFSPFVLLGSSTESPTIIAWVQLFAAIVAGLGAYLFCRYALEVSSWPAAIIGWCYPLTGFFVFWQGLPTCASAYWLGWILLVIDRVIVRPGFLAVLGLSITTCLVLISGHVDVAGQVLIASGLYAIWRAVHSYGFKLPRAVICGVIGGWVLGFLLASPHLLPLLEYARTGARMEARAQGKEDRPPGSLAQLPQVVLPDMYGASRDGSYRYAEGVQAESSAAGYMGLLAALLLAPLAWVSRTHRSFVIFSLVISIFALGWCLGLPLLVPLLRLPFLRMMSHNRLVFVASFCFLAMAAIGLDALYKGLFNRRPWIVSPVLILLGIGVWCFTSAIWLPEPIASHIGTKVTQGVPTEWIHNSADVHRLQHWFICSFAISGSLCMAGVAVLAILWIRPSSQKALIAPLGILLVADLLWFAHDRSAQCDPALYFPRIGALEDIAKSTPGRVIGYGCLPATLAQTHGLSDIRGYDGIDPGRLVELTAPTADPRLPVFTYARMQWLMPRSDIIPPDQIRMPRILDMLGIRYIIFRGAVPEPIHPAFQSSDYWVLVNESALPRTFVPQQVQTIANDRERMDKLASPLFDPRAIAYVEMPIDLPGNCRGDASIVSQTPTQITVSAQMQTPGLVVLADLWDPGWHAYLAGKPLPILRTNHAIRGVVVPAGNSTLEFRYRPASFVLGLWLAGFAATVLIAWMVIEKLKKDGLRNQ